MNDMPLYTLEEKAQAFDLLWKNCGNGRGKLITYKNVLLSRPQYSYNQEKFIRIPVYSFDIWYNGECSSFKDVLHSLATKE